MSNKNMERHVVRLCHNRVDFKVQLQLRALRFRYRLAAATTPTFVSPVSMKASGSVRTIAGTGPGSSAINTATKRQAKLDCVSRAMIRASRIRKATVLCAF